VLSRNNTHFGREAPTRILGLICLLLVCGILYAGLKPFRSPANEVSWVADGNALRFGHHGTILGLEDFSQACSRDGGRSLEIWLQPGSAKESGTVIAFYNPGGPRRFSLHQSVSDLELRIEPLHAWSRQKTTRLYIDSAFLDRRSAFWTITSGPIGTVVYRDGLMIRESAGFRVSIRELSGRIVLGNSPVFDDSWSGALRGVAIYDRALDGTQIARHYRTWAKGTRPEVTLEDACTALYLFDECSGRVIHNRVGSASDLYIPTKYMAVNQTVLDPVWRAFNWSLGFWEDALINVGGFIPVGCAFCAYLTARGLRWPAAGATALAGTLSLFIELAQSHLPTRDSSMADLLANIAGSIVGASLYRRVTANRLKSLCRS
jgi:hypothetical protein